MSYAIGNVYFCPRFDSSVYPNRNLRMSIDTATKISHDLKEIEFTGEVFITGFGEPLLHSQLHQLFKVITEHNSLLKCVTVVTNGDILTTCIVKSLRDSGVTNIVVFYVRWDLKQIQVLKDIISDILPYSLRERYYGPDEDYGIENINNRSGHVASRQIQTQHNDVLLFTV